MPIRLPFAHESGHAAIREYLAAQNVTIDFMEEQVARAKSSSTHDEANKYARSQLLRMASPLWLLLNSRHPNPTSELLRSSQLHYERIYRMAVVYVEARPKARPEGSPITDYVVENQHDGILGTFRTQEEAISWAKRNGHSPHVARVRHLNDKKRPDHWRAV